MQESCPIFLVEFSGRQKMIETATFGGGCFWGVELKFSQLEGVVGTTAGYMGGTKDNPTYEEVCTDSTGHAEVVQIEFNPSIISYENLLTTFWKLHDPTQLNRQGVDIGRQYRSVIFYHSEAQKLLALSSKEELDKSCKYNQPVVTEITKALTFYKAEDYHQQYLAKRGHYSCGI